MINQIGESWPNYCSVCGIEHYRNGRYCLACHAAYMREWRKTHKLTGDAKVRDSARHIAGVYKRRGRLKQEPCIKCGDENSQMHHDDYSKPLEVTWLCRECHLEHHRLEKQAA